VFLSKYDVILLIQSFAYLSISLDISGFFKASAFYIVSLARGDGLRLLVYLYLLCSALTYFTSNDIVIISMTPISESTQSVTSKAKGQASPGR
jgi:arsenical pump membrane protein